MSEAHHVIRRFSEDVDLTFDIWAIAPNLVGENREASAMSRSEERRWSNEVSRRLPERVASTVQPVIANATAIEGLAGTIHVEADKLFVDY